VSSSSTLPLPAHRSSIYCITRSRRTVHASRHRCSRRPISAFRAFCATPPRRPRTYPARLHAAGREAQGRALPARAALPRENGSDERCKERQRGYTTQSTDIITMVLCRQELWSGRPISFWRLLALHKGPRMARRTGAHATGCVRTPSASTAINTPADCWILSQTVLVWTTWPTHCPRSARRRRADGAKAAPTSSRYRPGP
jgi:hypothetical protein